MSAAARLISGSVAAWAQIAVNMVAQIVLVPIYLNYWSVDTYGVWLAIQGIMSALSMLDMGHQNFMGYEFLRIGRQNIPALCKYFCSAAIIAVGIGIVLSFTDCCIFLHWNIGFSVGCIWTGRSCISQCSGYLFDYTSDALAYPNQYPGFSC